MEQKEMMHFAIKQVKEFSTGLRNVSRFVSDDFAFIRCIQGAEDLMHFLVKFRQPFRLMEGRVVYMRSGYIDVRVNLREIRIEPHQLVVASRGTVLQVLYVSSDCDLSMLAVSNNFMEDWQKEELLMSYLSGRLYLKLPLEEQEEWRMELMCTLMWEVMNDRPFPKETLQSLVSALFRQIECFCAQKQTKDSTRYTRKEEVFNRFLELVNKYAVRERNVSFYADRLYLTPRYLSTLIRQISGRTIMDWINEAVLQEAKLMLRHSDKLVYQVSDALNFPNASFFCKFFRRLTGKTPNEYKQEVWKKIADSE